MTVLDKNRLANKTLVELEKSCSQSEFESVLKLLQFRIEFKISQLQNKNNENRNF